MSCRYELITIYVALLYIAPILEVLVPKKIKEFHYNIHVENVTAYLYAQISKNNRTKTKVPKESLRQTCDIMHLSQGQ